MRQALIVMSVVCCFACGNKRDDVPATSVPPAGSAAGSGSAAAASAPAPVAAPAAPVAATPPPAPPAPPVAPAGDPPPDGKYGPVIVDGITVPMINVMQGGTVVLVDTDGKKPRTWEEQYKKKTAKLAGQFDLHKTDVNKNGKFDDDPVDRQGLWIIDAKGNITRH